jgi:hypothetical protein
MDPPKLAGRVDESNGVSLLALFPRRVVDLGEPLGAATF